MDHPERYEHEKGRKPIPYPAGILFVLGTLGIGLIDSTFWMVVPFVWATGIIAFWDDIKLVSAPARFLFQVGVASLLFLAGLEIDFIGNPFAGDNFFLGGYPVISFVLTVLWIVGIQNAMNFLDGLGGLSVGISGVGFLTLGVLGLVRPELFFDDAHTGLTLVNLYLAGLCAGGFWFFWKKKMMLGDTGSQVLGVLLAIMSIFSGAKIATTLLVLGIPLIDTGFVVARRLFIEKRAPWKGDTKHLHHNLAHLWGNQKTVLVMVGMSFILGFIGVLSTSNLKMWLLLACVIFIFGLCLWAYKKRFRKSEK